MNRSSFPVIFLLSASIVVVLATGVVILSRMEPLPEVLRPVERPSTMGRSNPATTPAVEPVAPLKRHLGAHLLVLSDRTLSEEVVASVQGQAGVATVEPIDAARLTIAGRHVSTVGVDPSSFRSYTPGPTARADALWQSIASGDAAVSFSLGTDGGLALGTSVSAGGQKLRVGAVATMGLGVIDAVVSTDTARRLGLPQKNALLVNAPRTNSASLKDALSRKLPRKVQVVVLKPAFTPVRPGRSPASLSEDRIRTVLTATASKLGAPYVWGAEGPDTFDCSGLIQWAFGRAGIRLPRVTHQQFASGPQVPFAEMRPGDLIFWRLDPTNPGYISHAAIYWGDGKMIQAPRTGDVVKIVSVHTRKLAGVVRVAHS
ncbi:NlpC/P60 family protein [Nonomuraea zeae]|uniref:NlpC/P60 family protein n=2 Tax=Nonomuraea zeae TaxID=1642303 RepID=A0A5S4GY38_9ACTN|nr:NlpC/P60 family protein [Nonomuraea zeae]